MKKRTFPLTLLKDGWGLPHGYGATEQEAEILSDEVFDSGRWHEFHHLVFRAPDDGLLWQVPYSQGLTEVQDNYAWDSDDIHVDEDGNVEGVQVEPVQVTVTHYKPVEG